MIPTQPSHPKPRKSISSIKASRTLEPYPSLILKIDSSLSTQLGHKPLTFVRRPRGHPSLPALGGQAIPAARPSRSRAPTSSCSPGRRTSIRPGLCTEGARPQEGTGLAWPLTRHPPHVTRGAHALLARPQKPSKATEDRHTPWPRPHQPGHARHSHALALALPNPALKEPTGSGLCLRARHAGKCSPQRGNW